MKNNFKITKIVLISLLGFFPFKVNSFEPLSGIVCKNLTSNYQLEFLFKKSENNQFAKAFKRIEGKFKEVGNVVGKKLSSFILFEDKTIYPNLDFAWHLDEVTKNIKPFILSDIPTILPELPKELSCISKNFWY